MKALSQFCALGCIVYFTIFSHSGLLNLDVMEARNIVTAREMAVNHNWLLPTMNGEIRIAKPPLPTWVTALPIVLTGHDDQLGTLRFPAGVAASLMVFFVFFLTKTLTNTPYVPFLTAAVLASSEILMIMGRRASWDVFSHAFMIGAIWLLVSEWRKDKNSWGIFFFAGVLMGLSFLSKGPVSFHSMLLPFFVSYIYVFGLKGVIAKWRENALCLIICVLISVAWPLYLLFNIPELSMNVGASEMHTWVAHSSKPFWYYLPFPIHSGIWVCLMFAALIYPLVNKKPYCSKDRDNYIFSIIWTLLTVVILTLVPKKSTHYLLPVVVPASLLIGFYARHLLTAFLEHRQTLADRIVISIHESMVLLLSLASLVLYLYYGSDAYESVVLRIYLPPIMFFGIASLSYYFYRKEKVFSLFVTTTVLVCSFCFFIQPVIRDITHQRSFMALKMSRNVTKGKNLSLYSSYEMNIKEIWAIGGSVKKISMESLGTMEKRFALFSKQDPYVLLQDKGMSPLRILSMNTYVDTTSTDTWYLSIIENT